MVDAPAVLDRRERRGASGRRSDPAGAGRTLAGSFNAGPVEMLIERHFVWQGVDKDGLPTYHTSLPRAFIDAFMQLPPGHSSLPTVRGVCTAPMVARNGAIIDGIGLDRQTGLYHAIDPALRACV